jgi:hypothetical protein
MPRSWNAARLLQLVHPDASSGTVEYPLAGAKKFAVMYPHVYLGVRLSNSCTGCSSTQFHSACR